jgi:hypothetical protein
MKGRRLGTRLAIVTTAGAAWLTAGWLVLPSTPGPGTAQAERTAHAAHVVHAAQAVHAAQRVQAASGAAECARGMCRSGVPAARDLSATQQAQVNGYFCGPATVSEMLAQMGQTVTQRQAAGELGTNAGGTGWSDLNGNPVPRVLNQNEHRNNYVAIGLPWTPTRSQVRAYERNLVTDINHRGGVPLAGDADEVPGGPHLVGHPVNQTIFHWFDIRGYQKYGALTDYEDSVHGASSIGWSATVPAYSTLPSATIVDIIGARGYDW